VKPQFVVLDAETMALVDTTGAASLVELFEELADRNIIISIAAAKAPVRLIMDRAGASEEIGSERLYPTVASAVEGLLRKQPA
jgi:sulfate permease, SulP family